MTKKDFVIVASAIRQELATLTLLYSNEQGHIDTKNIDRWATKYNQTVAVAYSLANALQATNPRFDRHLFLEACGAKSHPFAAYVNNKNETVNY